MNEATILAEIKRTQRLLLSLHKTHLFFQEIIMSELTELQANVAMLKQRALDAKEDAARHEARTVAAVGLLQALVAKIAELANAAAGATPAELAALRDETALALADFDTANTQRDAADDVLGQGTADNTPAP